MALFLRHDACPQCGSKDNLAVYDDGSYFCFSYCGYKSVSEEYKELLEASKGSSKKGKKTMENTEKEKPLSQKPAITLSQAAEIKEETSVKAKGFRGIKDETYSYFGVRHKFDEETGEVTEQYYPITQHGELTGYKIREVPKNFRSIGRTGADCDLFGQFRFNRGGKYVIVTEGECLLPSTQVLTKQGWISLERYELYGGEVMQANGTFAQPIAIISKDYIGDMISYRSGSYQLDMTPEHNMLRVQKDGSYSKVKAGDSTQKHKPVPRTVKTTSDSDNLNARLQVMLSADFTFRESGDIYGRLKKERKIVRAKKLLDAKGVRYSANPTSNGCVSFFIHRGHGLNVSKVFNYERDLPSAATIIDEILFWDGNSVPSRNQIEYSTVLKENADFIQTCAHLCGYTSTIINRNRDKYDWYKVSILFGKQTSSTQQGFSTYPYNGKVMCLTMPHGTLMVRQNDSISLTGNCDQLAAYQILKEYNQSKGSEFEIAVVSPTTGAQSKKQIAAQYKFLDMFDNIVLSFDNDKAGQEAIDKLLPVLPKGKVKIMKMRLKDANEYLMTGKQREFITDFYNAEKRVPVGVLPSSDLYARILEQAEVAKIPFPPEMEELNSKFVGGLPMGAIINIAADTGLGKTTLVNFMLEYWVFNSPHTLGIVSMELDAGQYGEAMLSQYLQRKLALIGAKEERLKFLESDHVRLKADELFKREDGSPRFYLLDNRDGSVEEIQDTIEELVVACGCKVIILDVLQDVLDGLSNEEQALFLKWAKGIIKSHGCTLIFVNHMRKVEAGKSGADSEMNIMGSSTIIKSASANILLKRDKMAEDLIKRNTTEIFVTKNRLYGLTGPAGALYYDNEKARLFNLDVWLKENGPDEF